MKYHVSVDCQESYIFPRDYIFPKCAALRGNIVPRENITILAPPTRDISSVPVDICYIRWSKLMISSKFYVLYDYTTKFGNKTRSLRTKQNWTQTWQLARVLLWRSIVTHCVLCVTRCISFWVSFLIWNWWCCCCHLYFIYYRMGRRISAIWLVNYYVRICHWRHAISR